MQKLPWDHSLNSSISMKCWSCGCHWAFLWNFIYPGSRDAPVFEPALSCSTAQSWDKFQLFLVPGQGSQGVLGGFRDLGTGEVTKCRALII